jgi:DNA-binding transcriptional ArsR family regulator
VLLTLLSLFTWFSLPTLFTAGTYLHETMSIDRDTFENTSEEELADLSIPDQVLGFLVANEEYAFKAREIAAQTDIDEGAVSTALSRLKDRGLVEHKATYWAVTDDTERLDGYSGYERATVLFNEQFGEEDQGAWCEHSPDDPHPSVENQQ